MGHSVVDCRWRVSGVTDALKHAKGLGTVACPPTVDGIHRASEKEQKSEDGHRCSKEEEPEGEMPATAYARVRRMAAC
jgi:hypothetical protein